MIAHFHLVYQVTMLWTLLLINSELKCLDRWLKSNKISINADKTKYMLFSYNKNANFPDISEGTILLMKLLLLNFSAYILTKNLIL